MATKQRKILEFNVDVVVEPDGELFHAHCPALKGLHVDGETEEEALENAADAAVLYLQSMIKRNEPIPLTTTTRVAGTRRSRRHTRRLAVQVA